MFPLRMHVKAEIPDSPQVRLLCERLNSFFASLRSVQMPVELPKPALSQAVGNWVRAGCQPEHVRPLVDILAEPSIVGGSAPRKPQERRRRVNDIELGSAAMEALLRPNTEVS